jgi:hypothetical protein
MSDAAAKWFANFRQTHAMPAGIVTIFEWFENVMQMAYDVGALNSARTIKQMIEERRGKPAGATMHCPNCEALTQITFTYGHAHKVHTDTLEQVAAWLDANGQPSAAVLVRDFAK